MKYDVFISYSRKDMEFAEALCKVLDSVGVNYWIDRNIHGSANFLSEITRNIRDCKAVLFIASSNSAVSIWTQKEILYALKKNKYIVPYRIGNFSFDDNAELDFVFMNVQWIESEDAVISALKELDCCSENEKHASTALVDSCTLSTNKIYKVGDYYNDGIKEGVVFEVSSDGRHGKIVSMRQSAEELQWSSDFEEQTNLISAESETDGLYNMSKVKMVSCWQQKFPAFKWCVDLGEGWYLPSIKELEQFILNDSIYDAINQSLSANGGEVLFSKKSQEAYWSSTETRYHREEGFCAHNLYMCDNDNAIDAKFFSFYVRAVAVFGDGFSVNEDEVKSRTLTQSYKVGDYYNENGKEGVVFEVSSDGLHGKIVSMTQSVVGLRWALDEIEQKRFIGTDSMTDGAYNMSIVKSIPNWERKYPAFKWCADIGSGWYLPAVKELVVFTLNDSVNEAVNRTLSAKGATKLYKKGDLESYWSSEESPLQYETGNCCSWAVDMGDRGDVWNSDKSYELKVRAVAVF